MPGYAYGSLGVDVYAVTAGVAPAVEKASKEAGEKGGKAAGSAWGKGFLELAAVVAAEKIGETILEAAEQSETITKRTEAVVKSTGGVAHVSAEQVSELADAIMRKSGVDAEATRSGENMLLSFRNIRNETGRGNDIFNQATTTLTDMTAALTGATPTAETLRAKAVILGKALNDPVKGMAALTRVGVQFTEQQKEQIKAMVKSGDTLGAQKMILGQLNAQFAGAAAAYATPMERLHVATHELAVQAGTALLPAVGAVATWLTNVGIPALQTFGHWLAQNKAWVVPLAGALASFVTTLYLISKAFAVAQAAAELFGVSLELSLGPITLIIAGLIAVGVGLYLLWTRSRTFRVIVEAAFYGVRDAVMAVVRWFAGPFAQFFTVTIPGIFKTLLAWLSRNWPLIVGILTGPVGLAVVLIIRYWTQIRNFITSTVGAVEHIVRSVFTSIASFIGGIASQVTSTVQRWWGNVVNAISTALARAWTNLSGWFARLPGQIAAWGVAGVQAWVSLGGSMISGMLNGISSAMAGIGSWIKRVVVDPVVNAVKHFFGIKSPSTVMESVGENLTAGLFKGLQHDAGGLVKMVFGGWPAALGGLISKGFASITALPGKALSALGSVAGKVGGFLKGLFGGGGVGAGVARWGGLMHSVLQMFGLDNLFGVFMAQMQTESGGNPNAINLWDSNAAAGIPSQGLLQVVPPTFAAYAGPFRSRGILDPLANIYAAVAYAVARYGANIAAVLGHGHGYATGGVVSEPVTGFGQSGQLYHFGEAGPELITPLAGPGAGVGRSQPVVINVYPRASQSEVEIAAAVSRQLGWAQATGRA
jgi:transglycosylase-like protein with SLT domain